MSAGPFGGPCVHLQGSCREPDRAGVRGQLIAVNPTSGVKVTAAAEMMYPFIVC